MIEYHLHARGKPAPKGSWNPIGCGRPLLNAAGERHYRLRDVRLKAQESESLARWKHALELAVLDAGRPPSIHECIIEVEITFWLHRPKEPKDPRRPIVAPDLDKLQRAVGDVLQGTYYADDSQITDWHARKRFESAIEPEGADITIRVIEDENKSLTFPEREV
jgi:Holliday junction resolvase RusA-like endonuclease